MNTWRIIPLLLMDQEGLVKTKKFKDPVYIGDPLNTVRIFNNKFVDEIIILDISRSKQKQGPNIDLVARISPECFMPLAYGGGINSIDDAKRIFGLGVEKIVINNASRNNSKLINQVANYGGQQSLCISIDISGTLESGYYVFDYLTGKCLNIPLNNFVSSLESQGAGEILVTAVDKEGTFSGYDLDLVAYIRENSSLPIIVNGGAKNTDDFLAAIAKGADAVAAGSMFVFHGSRKSVLINYPSNRE